MEGAATVKMLWIILSTTLLLFSSEYQSHYPYESDTILTSWLIKRYVDKDATFRSLPKSVKINKEHAINTPTSPFRRNARYTAYEMAKRHYNISDKCSDSLVRVIKVLEMMPWKKHEYEDILAFEEGLAPLFPQETGETDLSKVFAYIDQYCKELE
jgi:hypothetical protein